jgi:hypothetical protein
MNDVKKKAHTHSSVENYTKLFQRIAQTLKKKWGVLCLFCAFSTFHQSINTHNVFGMISPWRRRLTWIGEEKSDKNWLVRQVQEVTKVSTQGKN